MNWLNFVPRTGLPISRETSSLLSPRDSTSPQHLYRAVDEANQRSQSLSNRLAIVQKQLQIVKRQRMVPDQPFFPWKIYQKPVSGGVPSPDAWRTFRVRNGFVGCRPTHKAGTSAGGYGGLTGNYELWYGQTIGTDGVAEDFDNPDAYPSAPTDITLDDYVDGIIIYGFYLEVTNSVGTPYFKVECKTQRSVSTNPTSLWPSPTEFIIPLGYVASYASINPGQWIIDQIARGHLINRYDIAASRDRGDWDGATYYYFGDYVVFPDTSSNFSVQWIMRGEDGQRNPNPDDFTNWLPFVRP